MKKTSISPSSTPKKQQGRRTAIRVLILLALLIAVMALAFAYPLAMRGWNWLHVTWRHPWALLLLLLAPIVLWRGTLGEDNRLPRMRMGTLHPFLQGPQGWRARLKDLPGIFRAAAITMLVMALAQPISMMRPESTDELGIDIVLVLDLSGSMRAVMDAPASELPRRAVPKGLRPTRLDIAKYVMQDFISLRKTDRIGVVVFGKSAYVLSPPTLDYQLLDTLVGKMTLDLIDGTATAIGDALGVAVARLRRSDARSKAVVLLTDGDSNAGAIAPQYAAHLATVVGCRVYTIQIGNGDDVDVQDGVDLFGHPRYVQRRFPVNPELLHEIAKTTGGEAYVATDAKALRESMHDVLDNLEKTRFEASQATYEDLFVLLLLPGVWLVALDALSRAWMLRRFP
ncbi:MAG TPA: VWA domain-containing protein [Polyangiaceae bacterium]|jgi:Ca-activated chloride channel family protein|nr:MAG: von Willebrand factor type A domain protein [Deltaproteobacteria bacterium ADurb.Bin207]HNS97212.1 VWA domain-containing protein [Polyangiaceae bacterium]HNZ21105.1 VWA domain-containing protein [Polyangiaceae bacterium]HOD24725.1 VWA domain-containing protein [Polyangiaceae bacterium]HOE47875.1 VWA domain-containing protein [Polyangiaceae bacterium]